MAVGFLVCVAPDSHISYLQDHPGFVGDYLDGMPPHDSVAQSSLPDWWPQQPPAALSAWSVNYRNTDLYHWMLNGSPDLVSGAGAIFQTWYEPGHALAVIKLDHDNERFALHSDRIDELLSLVAAVNMQTVYSGFVGWCKSQGKAFEDIDDYACEPFVAEFSAFADLLQEAKQKGGGIIW